MTTLYDKDNFFLFLEFVQYVVVLIFAQNVTKKIFGALYDHSFSNIPSIVMKIFVLEKKKRKIHFQLFHLYSTTPRWKTF